MQLKKSTRGGRKFATLLQLHSIYCCLLCSEFGVAAFFSRPLGGQNPFTLHYEIMRVGLISEDAAEEVGGRTGRKRVASSNGEISIRDRRNVSQPLYKFMNRRLRFAKFARTDHFTLLELQA